MCITKDSLFSLVCLNRTSTGGALRWCSPGGGVTCSTQAGGAPPGVHPVPLHPLEQPQSRHGHLVGLLPELQHVGEARDVETGVCGERERERRGQSQPTLTQATVLTLPWGHP